MSQMTAIVILSTGAHLCLNNGGAPWEVFRKSLLQAVIDTLVVAPVPGAHVLCAVVAHEDHFHEIVSQAEFFRTLTMDPRELHAPATQSKSCH